MTLDYTRAKCASPTVDSSIFFPEFDDDARTIKAKNIQAISICNTCPLKRQCLEAALDTANDYGTWGGVTEDVIRRARFSDTMNRPHKERPSIICPQCLTNDYLYVIEVFRKSSDVGCTQCELDWEVKKVLDIDNPAW